MITFILQSALFIDQQLLIINNQLSPGMAQMIVAPSTTTPSANFISTLHYQQSISPQQMVMQIPGIESTDNIITTTSRSSDTLSTFPVVVDDIGFCEGMQYKLS